jgi:hypothetical protein
MAIRMTVNDFMLEVTRLDKEIRGLVKAPVLHINSTFISEYRALKEKRRGYVQAIQAYQP